MEREGRTALRLLGNTPRQIANSLHNKGITGCQGAASSCPISVYLNQQFPGYLFSVSGGMIIPFHFTPSKAIDSFIYKFDAGHYPELIAEGN